MDSERTNSCSCDVCGEREAAVACDGCRRPLCKKCRSIEIWRTSKEDVTLRSFCPQCRDSARMSRQGPDARVFGLGQVTDMVNQEQGRAGRFKIRLKI